MDSGKKLTEALSKWWLRVRLGLDRIEFALLERIARDETDEAPIVLANRIDTAVAVGYIRLARRGFVEKVGKSNNSYIYLITDAGRAALNGIPHV